jgi:uncharacterized protein YchJ
VDIVDQNDASCRLCGRKDELQISHIFPKFVVDWLKKTGTGYLRKATLVNRRSQDASKERMLCVECEQKFSAAENYFSSQIFHLVLSGATNISYDSRLIYFFTSLLWRVKQVNLPKAREKKNRFLSTIDAAEREWRHFLLGSGPLDRFAHIHLLVFDIAENPPPLAKGYNVYCARALDGTFFNNEKSCYVYAKFARFLCIAILTPYDEQEWVNTQIVNEPSTLNIPQELRDTFVGNFTVHWAKTIAEIVDSEMSARQNKVIEEHVFRNADRIANSDLARAAFADYEGQQAFVASLPKIGRNEKCPCGSGPKFKNCHGKKISNVR